MNSRGLGGGDLGAGGGWRHSYQWSGSIGSYGADLGIPDSYTINYPGGRIITFSGNGGTYLGPVGCDRPLSRRGFTN